MRTVENVERDRWQHFAREGRFLRQHVAVHPKHSITRPVAGRLATTTNGGDWTKVTRWNADRGRPTMRTPIIIIFDGGRGASIDPNDGDSTCEDGASLGQNQQRPRGHDGAPWMSHSDGNNSRRAQDTNSRQPTADAMTISDSRR